MWRLTEEALHKGVKSTTRYRSKQPNKRGNRTQHPQPQRQASGAKDGQAARRSANMKRSKRVQNYRSEPHIARSVPAAFDPPYTPAHDQAYPPGPYYGNEVEYAYNPDHSKHNGLGFFSSAQPFMGGDSAYILIQGPSEPLFTNSPTPSADEPRTPMSGSGGWNELEVGSLWENREGLGLGFQDYAG
jgi:hypothetical protein